MSDDNIGSDGPERRPWDWVPWIRWKKPFMIAPRRTLRELLVNQPRELAHLREIAARSTGQETIRGDATKEGGILYQIFEYLDRIPKDPSEEGKAADYIDRYFREKALGEDDTAKVYEADSGGTSTQRTFLPAVRSQSLSLKRVWVIKQCRSEDIARLEQEVNCGNRLRRKKAGRYLVEEEVPGPNVFELLLKLQEGNGIHPEHHHAIRRAILEQTVEDLARFNANPPEIPKEMVEEPTYAEKVLDMFASRNVELTGAQEQGVMRVADILKGQSGVPFRDAALWNTSISYIGLLKSFEGKEGFDEELTKSCRRRDIGYPEVTQRIFAALNEGRLDIEDVVEAFRENVYQIDFDKINRKTFLGDDVGTILHAPISGLSPDEIVEMETKYLEMLEPDPERRSCFEQAYHDTRNLGLFYRSFRFWQWFGTGTTFRKSYGDHQDHYLALAYQSLHMAVHRETAPERSIPRANDLRPFQPLLEQLV